MKVSVVAAVAVPMATVVAMAVGAPTVQISVTVAVSMILRSGVMSVVAVVAMTQQRRMFLWLVVSVVAAVVAETTHPKNRLSGRRVNTKFCNPSQGLLR
jgi:hypothetical protein